MIRALVASTGLSQVAAAHAIGLDPRTLRRYIKADAAPLHVRMALELLAVRKISTNTNGLPVDS